MVLVPLLLAGERIVGVGVIPQPVTTNKEAPKEALETFLRERVENRLSTG